MHPTIDEFTQRRAHTRWNGEHRDIPYSISFWGYQDGTDSLDRDGPHGIWNFYLLLSEPQWRPNEFTSFLAPPSTDERLTRRGQKHWEYHESALVNLDWHSDMTFYEITGDVPYRVVKAGCDYNHLWDAEAGYPARLETVEADARRCVDSLLVHVAPLVRCRYSGEYGELEEMVPTKWPGKYVLAKVRNKVWDSWFQEVSA